MRKWVRSDDEDCLPWVAGDVYQVRAWRVVTKSASPISCQAPYLYATQSDRWMSKLKIDERTGEMSNDDGG